MGSAPPRREFLETTTGLIIAFALPWRADAAVATAVAPPPFAPNAWLRIGTDGIVTLTIDRSELGQGSQTGRSEEHTSELQSLAYLVCRLLLEKKKRKEQTTTQI